MKDEMTTISELKQKVAEFVAQRDWEKYHKPKNLAMSLAIETAELMEHFQWIDHKECEEYLNDPQNASEISDEIADIFSYLLSFANATGIDLAGAIEKKMKKNAEKYPADKVRGHYKVPDENQK